MEKQTEILIRKAQRGSISAFEDLVHQYDKKVMALILNMVNDSEDAKDLYQEIFIKVFLSIKNYRFESQFYTWLFRIVVNTCINFRKKRSARPYDSLEDYNKASNGITVFPIKSTDCS